MSLCDNPYMAVTDAAGNFRIKDLPVGKHEFQLWHESAGYLSGIPILGEKAMRGRIKIVIKPGENTLGDVAVPSALFKHRHVPPFPRVEPQIEPPLAKTGLVEEPH